MFCTFVTAQILPDSCCVLWTHPLTALFVHFTHAATVAIRMRHTLIPQYTEISSMCVWAREREREIVIYVYPWWLYVCSFQFVSRQNFVTHIISISIPQHLYCNTLTHLREKNNDLCHLYTHLHTHTLSLKAKVFWGYLVSKNLFWILTFLCLSLLHPVLFGFCFTDSEVPRLSLCTKCVSKGFTLSPYCYLHPVITSTHVSLSVPPPSTRSSSPVLSLLVLVRQKQRMFPANTFFVTTLNNKV